MNTRALERLLNAVSDLLSGALALGLVFWWQFGSGAVEGEADFSADPTQLLLPWLYLSVFWAVLFTLAGLYRKWSTESRSHHLGVLSLSVALGALLLAPILFGPQALDALAAGEPLSVAENPFARLVSIDTIGELAAGDRLERERLTARGMEIVSAAVSATLRWLTFPTSF